jgi:hypothetical protein
MVQTVINNDKRFDTSILDLIAHKSVQNPSAYNVISSIPVHRNGIKYLNT